MCGKAVMDDSLLRWDEERGEDERLWVVVPEPGSHVIMAYYAVEPDPVELATPGATATCDDGVIYLNLLATDKRYQGQGWAERLLLRVIYQIVELPPSTGVEWLITDALDAEAQEYLHSRGFGFQLVPPPNRRLAVSIDTLRDLVLGGWG